MTDDDDPSFYIELCVAEYVRSIIFNAKASALTMDDLAYAAEHADSLEALDHAVDLLGMGAIEIDALGTILKGTDNGR